MQAHHIKENTDPVGDEVGRVLGKDDPFAEFMITKLGDRFDNPGPGFRAGNDFQQMGIARGIVKMGDKKSFGQFRRHLSAQRLPGKAVGIGAEDRLRFQKRLDPTVEILLDRLPLNHRFDHPVGVGDNFQVFFIIAGGDKFRLGGIEQRRGLQPGDLAEVLIGGLLIDIIKQHRNVDAGEQGSDLPAHQPTAQDRNLLDGVCHVYRSPPMRSITVAMPWPPPMAMAARP